MEPCLKRRRVTMPFPPSLDSWSIVERVDSSLYSTLLLHLGYSLSSPSSSFLDADDDELLLAHMCKLWSRLVDAPSHFFVDNELEVDICVQLLETVSTEKKEIIGWVLHVVCNLLDRTNVVAGNQLAKALIRHADNNRCTIVQLLHTLAKASSSPAGDNHQAAVILYTAACCVMGGNNGCIEVDYKLVDRKLFHLGMTKDDKEVIDEKGAGTFLWALSFAKGYACHMSLTPCILQYLVANKQSETLALIAEQYPTEEVATHLINLLMEKECNNHELVLKGLLKCVRLLQPSQDLYDTILHASSPISIVAADLICQLVEKRKRQSDESLVQLLSSHNMRVAEIAMTHIAKCQQELASSFQPSSSLVSAIAEVASRNSATLLTKEQAIELFAVCAKDKSRWIEMARDSKLVEVLVGAVPNPMAMETLWQISTPMSNQRILARHTGLLSSWIRFLRNIPPNNPRRVEWKDRLMELAGLL